MNSRKGGPADLARLRLAAQRLVGPHPTSAADVVRLMTAMQAQDLPGAVRSVALRTKEVRASVVRDAFDHGTVVRSWPMRGTLHLVAAEDLRWMLDLTTERLLAGARTRRSQLGIDEAMVDRAGLLARDALAGGRELTRAELMDVWDQAGLLGVPQRGYHLLWHLSQGGLLCWGPCRGDAEQRVVLLDEWVRRQRRLDRESALGEWALRYFRSHGPATVADFTWWTRLLVKDVKVGVALARPRLETLVVDGTEYLMDPETPDRLAAARAEARGVLLLPGFDEYLLGYRDRGAALPVEHADKVTPGANGMFLGTVVSGGQVVGTWRRGRAARLPVEATPFTTFSAKVARVIPDVYAALP